jgi:hypothetical protein
MGADGEQMKRFDASWLGKSTKPVFSADVHVFKAWMPGIKPGMTI